MVEIVRSRPESSPWCRTHTRIEHASYFSADKLRLPHHSCCSVVIRSFPLPWQNQSLPSVRNGASTKRLHRLRLRACAQYLGKERLRACERTSHHRELHSSQLLRH